MDERTLNDLLECSVCLERLDTSSKVLPCQHTFCRKCLQVIMSSRQELRCPECRILVDVKIDDLPPNVLLMRILEGLKNANQNQNNTTKSPRKNGGNIVTGPLSTNISIESSRIITNENPTGQGRVPSNQNASNRHIVPHAFALYDFISKEAGDLNFKKGDVILLKRKLDANWFVGDINGREGSFPINYVQVIVPLPVPQCIALYDFKMGPNEEEGCLTFKKGAIIQVLRRVDHNWAEGRIGSCIGIFPIAFVEMNSLAKQLLEVGSNPSFVAPRVLPPVPFDNNSSDSSSTPTTSPNSTCSSNTSTNSIPSSPSSNPTSPQNQGNVKYRDLKEKRHSLNALTGNTNLSVVQTNRHSAEILSVPDPAEVSNSEGSQSNSGAGASIRVQESHQQQQYLQQQQQQQQQQTARANVLTLGGGPPVDPVLPWAYVAVYPYKPKKNDELELKKGCVYFVTEKCLDGWYKGKNWADKSGVFPGNYVMALKSRETQLLMHQRKVKQNVNHGNHFVANVHPAIHNNHNYANLSTRSPPELPPRCNASPSGSAWTKPITQHVETFFNRKVSNAPQRDKNSSSSCSSSYPKNITSVSRDESNSQGNNSTKDKDKKESGTSSAVGIMKRLTNMKRSKSPTHSQTTYSIDNPVFEDTITCSVAPSSSKQYTTMSHPVHVRSGSCPSQLLQSLPMDLAGASTSGDSNSPFGSQRVKGHKDRPSLQSIRQQADNGRSRNHSEMNDTTANSPAIANAMNVPNSSTKQSQPQQSGPGIIQHRKSQSLDANTISAQISGNSTSGKVFHRESRFRCIVSYPPNSEMELELNVGDIVFVHRKQKNGWYKGTHARTNKTGLFPASFVEPDI